MKFINHLILVLLQLSLCAFGSESLGEKPRTPQAVMPALSITAFSMKSSDGKLEMKMDDQGRILVDGKHVATANPKGEFNTPEGKLLLRVKGNGVLDPDLMSAPVEVTRDGTLTCAGESRSWVEGKFRIGDKDHLEITPKDSPSKQAATLLFIIASAVHEVTKSN